MACCRQETDKYRQCLREKRSSGRKCDGPAKDLEVCREKWRKDHNVGPLNFDGTRIIPPKQCRALNGDVQACLKRTGVDEVKCRVQIDALKACMASAPGVVVPPPS